MSYVATHQRKRRTGMSYGATSKRARSKRPTRAYSKAALVVRKAEQKTVDVLDAQYRISTTAVFQSLNLIQAGVSEYQRIGRKVEMQGLYVKAFLNYVPQSQAVAHDCVRMIVLYDRQTNGALPAAADILKNLDQTGATSSTTMSFRNPDNEWRFKVIKDMTVITPASTLQASSSGEAQSGLMPTDGTYNWTFNWFLPLKGLTTQYKADSSPAVIGDIATGSLLFFMISENNPSASSPWFFQGSFRLKFNDKT